MQRSPILALMLLLVAAPCTAQSSDATPIGEYDKVVAITLRLIRQNPSYAAPYVLQGLAYTAAKKYPEAQQSFLAILQVFPNNQAAVEGLARVYYLSGDRQRALATLGETTKFTFPAPVRERFEALKGLYGQ